MKHLETPVEVININIQQGKMDKHKEMKPEIQKLTSVLTPVIRSLIITSLYPFTVSFNKQILKFYNVFIIILLWLNVLRFFSAYKSEEFVNGLNVKLASLIMTHFVYIYGSVNMTCCAWVFRHKKFREFLCTLDRIDRDILTSSDSEKYRRKTHIITFGFWVLFVFDFTYIAYSVWLTDIFNSSLVPFNSQTPYISVFKLFISILQLYWLSAILLPSLFLLSVCKNLKTRFKYLNAEFRRLSKRDQLLEIRRLRQRHQGICVLVNYFNEMWNVLTAMNLMFPLIIGLIQVYQLCWNRVIWADMVKVAAFASWIATFLFQLVINILGPVGVSEAAHELLDDIHSLIVDVDVETKEFQEFKMFLDRLSNGKIGLSALGMFIVGRDTLLSIFGALATYFIVLVQFQQSSTPTPNCDCSGNTTTA